MKTATADMLSRDSDRLGDRGCQVHVQRTDPGASMEETVVGTTMGTPMLRRVTDRHTWQTCRGLRHAVSASFAAAIALCMMAACSAVLPPGTPPGDPTPLFGGYRSYSTLDDLKVQLPDRSRWKIVADLKHPAHGACPPFDYLRIEVSAVDLGHTGTLELRFINERLKETVFTPDDSSPYLEALQRSGVVFHDGQAKIPPATWIWLAAPPHGSPVAIGWRDERFAEQATRWGSTCG